MMGGLKKKVGPLPLWAWVLIVGVAGGLLWYEHDKSASASSSTSASSEVDPATGMTYAQEQQEEQEGIDPFTDQSYASENGGYAYGGGDGSTDYPGGGSGATTDTTSSTPETFGQEISDVVGGIQALQAAGLVAAPGSTAGSSSTGSSTSTAKKKTTEKAAGGIKITNFKPKATSKTTVKGIGNGLYESIPKTTTKKLNTKTTTAGKKTTTASKSKKVTTGTKKGGTR